MMSIALSGMNRCLMYRSASFAAATSALSRICTPWCASYRSFRPRRMLTVSGTDGSFTSTCWNRRSNALSFSTCCRYSSSVVAPMQRSSPRASIGLSRFAASIAPVPVAPAPRIRCISSINRITLPALSFTSLSTAFRRSSNSPRYLAPATSAPMSRLMTWQLSDSGTSPITIRCASPSTIAVLPTPGSPISTGLFFVRRERMRITRRISSSRPITGSILPASASCTRFCPYLLSASYVSSALLLLTVRPPRIAATCAFTRLSSIAFALKIAATCAFEKSASTRWSTAMCVSFISLRILSAYLKTFIAAESNSTVSGGGCCDGSSLSCWRTAVSAPSPLPPARSASSRASPVGSAKSAAARCSGVACACPCSSAISRALCTYASVLSVKSCGFIVVCVVLLRCVVLSFFLVSCASCCELVN
ncbi:hypothetical protein PybrP1_004347, partial [[Pythium] brassicae (nom. inval.)]